MIVVKMKGGATVKLTDLQAEEVALKVIVADRTGAHVAPWMRQVRDYVSPKRTTSGRVSVAL